MQCAVARDALLASALSIFYFLNGFALFTRLLPLLVDLQIKLNNAAPSVQFHYRTFSPTTGCSAPVPRISTLTLMGSSHLSFSLSIGTTGSHVPHKSLDQIRATFMPDAAQAVRQVTLGLILEFDKPPVLTSSFSFRHLSSSSLALASLILT